MLREKHLYLAAFFVKCPALGKLSLQRRGAEFCAIVETIVGRGA